MQASTKKAEKGAIVSPTMKAIAGIACGLILTALGIIAKTGLASEGKVDSMRDDVSATRMELSESRLELSELRGDVRVQTERAAKTAEILQRLLDNTITREAAALEHKRLDAAIHAISVRVARLEEREER